MRTYCGELMPRVLGHLGSVLRSGGGSVLCALAAVAALHAPHATALVSAQEVTPSPSPRALPGATTPSLQVLHWWTSTSERRAADLLSRHLADQGISWRDAAVPGGAGVGAGKVLRGRVLAGDAPDVTQMIGVTIAEVADMGLLLELNGPASVGPWSHVLFPTVYQWVRYRGHAVAAPLGIHRINVLFTNRRLLERWHLKTPVNWPEFKQVAQALQSRGITAFAQSSEPWQVATLFESLVLAEGGPALHRALFQQRSILATSEPRLAAALERLRELKAFMGPSPVPEIPWVQVVERLRKGEAAMMVMGDWTKGELMASGWAPGVDFTCHTTPGTAQAHLYSIDTLTMFAKDYANSDAQDRLARLVMTPVMQSQYNAIKGSVTVRRDADPSRMDPCAKASWQDFSRGVAMQAPSMVHRMATDEASKDAIIAEIHRYFVDDRVTPADVQQRLAAIFRVLPSRSNSAPTPRARP